MRAIKAVQALLGTLLAAVLILPMSSAGSAAAARVDQTGPRLDTPRLAEFVTGARVTGRDGELFFTDSIPARVSWRSKDRSSVCGVTVERVFAGFPPTVVVADGPSSGEFLDWETDYDDQYGGGSGKIEGWRVTARDCLGNSTTAFVAGKPVAVQEDNSTAGWPGAALSYSGEWAPVACADCQAGAAAQTAQPGAAVQIEAPPGSQVALILRRGPQYGIATILIEGKPAARVNTYATEPAERVIVWSAQLGDGQEKITVINKAKPASRSILALDSVITRPGATWG